MGTDTSVACANIELVHRAYEAWNRGAREEWLDTYAADAEWDLSHAEFWLEDTLYHGRDEMAKVWDFWFGSWDEYHLDVLELKALGEDKVWSVNHQCGRGKQSGIPVGQSGAGLNVIHDGRLARFEMWTDIEAARRAVGAEGGGLELVKRFWESTPPNVATAFASERYVAALRGAVAPLLTDDFEFSLAEPDSPAIGGTWPGFDGLITGMREWLSEWETYGYESMRYIDTGPCVVVLADEVGTSRLAGIDLRSQSGSVYFLREGRIAKLDAYQSHARALGAAGLSEELAG